MHCHGFATAYYPLEIQSSSSKNGVFTLFIFDVSRVRLYNNMQCTASIPQILRNRESSRVQPWE